MGKLYDWDIEKYRKADKGSDKGNKKRFMRNFARFVKNPYGYTYWKFNRGRTTIPLFPFFILSSVAGTFFTMMKWNKEEKQRKGFL